LRSRGHADASASLTVCRLTRYLVAMARPDMPARDSLRIAANNSTFDIRGIGGPPSRPADAPPPPVAPKLADIESTRSGLPSDGAQTQ
jgi:hypothetical protein